jgi:hypothetical protein
VGTASFVLLTQRSIPRFIEQTFGPDALSQTDFKKQKSRYFSLRKTLTFSTNFIVVGFGIFYLCKFPFDGIAESFLIVWACVQYALGVYVGRKLFYIAHMLHAVADIRISKDIFTDDVLGAIVSYVNILSTLTVIFVYVHVTSYYHGPFVYDSQFTDSPRIALLLPAIIAMPVLVIFNFYPRSVLRKLYSASIDLEQKRIEASLMDEQLPDLERRAYLMEWDKLAKDDLRTRLQLSLSDLPIGITIVIMIIGLVVK